MPSSIDSSSDPQSGQPSSDSFLEDSPSPLRSFESEQADSDRSTEADLDDSDDADEPPRTQLSLGTPMPSRGDTPRVQTLNRILPSSRLSQAGEAGPAAPSVRRKRALTETATQNARRKKNTARAPPPPPPLPPAT